MQRDKLVRPMHSRGFILVALMCATVAGCGGGKPTPPPRPVPPAAVAIPAAAPPAIHNPKPVENAQPKQANAAEPTAKKAKPLPPGTNPQSVFDISAANEPFVVSPATPDPENQFEVEAGVKGIDSSRLIVVAVADVPKNAPRSGFTLPSGFAAVPSAGYSSLGLPLQIRCEKTDSTLALVPGGSATIGCSDGPSECQPEFTVQVDSFYMEMFESTVGAFEKYRADLKEKKKTLPTSLNPSASLRAPVLGVPWGAAQSFARWAGMELPTEVEFEKAARGPSGLRTPWGDGRALFVPPRTQATLTTVGSFATDYSPYGIYDLAGNAREWCADLYSDQAHREAAGNNYVAPNNWPGPKKVSNGNLRTVKGNGVDWSAWHRQGRDVGKGFPDVGFRCVLRIPGIDGKNGA